MNEIHRLASVPSAASSSPITPPATIGMLGGGQLGRMFAQAAHTLGYHVIVFDADEAERLSQVGDAVILVREETSPEDIHGMHAARGIVTARGGMTSHAAVVARGMGRPCVSGAGEISINEKAGTFTARENACPLASAARASLYSRSS